MANSLDAGLVAHSYFLPRRRVATVTGFQGPAGWPAQASGEMQRQPGRNPEEKGPKRPLGVGVNGPRLCPARLLNRLHVFTPPKRLRPHRTLARRPQS